MPKVKSQEAVFIPRDANPNTLPKFIGFIIPVPKPQGAFPAKVEPIEGMIDLQCGGEPSGPSRQVVHALDAAISPHDRDAFEWLKGPDQDSCSKPGHLA